MLNIGIQTTLV